MADYIDTIRRTLDELVERRRHIDADIADMRRIIARHEGVPPGQATRSTKREPGRASPRGEGRRETLEVLGTGDGSWTPTELAKARRVTPNAARAMLKRLAKEDPAPIEFDGRGYRLVSPNGDGQGSLSVAAERDSEEAGKEVDGVVSRAPA